jgi:hypothetical protein
MLQARPDSDALGETDVLTPCLAGMRFPATHDDLMVLALRRQAPSSVLWQLNRLPHHRRFTSVEDIRSELLSAPATPAVSRT